VRHDVFAAFMIAVDVDLMPRSTSRYDLASHLDQGDVDGIFCSVIMRGYRGADRRKVGQALLDAWRSSGEPIIDMLTCRKPDGFCMLKNFWFDKEKKCNTWTSGYFQFSFTSWFVSRTGSEQHSKKQPGTRFHDTIELVRLYLPILKSSRHVATLNGLICGRQLQLMRYKG